MSRTSKIVKGDTLVFGGKVTVDTAIAQLFGEEDFTEAIAEQVTPYRFWKDVINDTLRDVFGGTWHAEPDVKAIQKRARSLYETEYKKRYGKGKGKGKGKGAPADADVIKRDAVRLDSGAIQCRNEVDGRTCGNFLKRDGSEPCSRCGHFPANAPMSVDGDAHIQPTAPKSTLPAFLTADAPAPVVSAPVSRSDALTAIAADLANVAERLAALAD